MTFDVTGLLIFLLAIVPGFLAQQAHTLLIPRSLRSQSVLEETGNYVLNSILVHLFLLASFSVVLGLLRSATPAALGLALSQKQFGSWAWQHRYLIASYFAASLLLGFALGVLRGIAERDRRIGTCVWRRARSYSSETTAVTELAGCGSACERDLSQTKSNDSARPSGGRLKSELPVRVRGGEVPRTNCTETRVLEITAAEPEK